MALLSCTIAAFGAAPAGAADHVHADPGGDAKGRLDLIGASLVQDGPGLTLTMITSGHIPAASLPDGQRGTLCAAFAWGDPSAARRRLCVVSQADGLIVHDNTLSPTTGKITGQRTRSGLVTQSGPRLSIALDPQALEIPLGALRWNVRSTWHRGADCVNTAPATTTTRTGAIAAAGLDQGLGCVDTLPDSGTFAGRVSRAIAAGCLPSSGQVFNGPRARKVVALTFDDGPSTFTPSYVKILAANNARATFFQIGQQVLGQGAIERAILAGGNAIGNHTWNHANVSGGGGAAQSQISRTSATLSSVTGGYKPCIFRPPYGATSSSLVSVSSGLGLKSILWDVDTNDWQLPGMAAIISRAVGGARSGSIILMHDGGGPRGGTQAAIAPIIRQLRAKGYGFVTVPQLLGLKDRWRYSNS